MDAERIAKGLENWKKGGEYKWIACCPAHDDKNPSLSIKQETDKVLVHCFAGCSQAAVISALIDRGLWYREKSGHAVEKPKFSTDQLEHYLLFVLVWNAEVAKGNVPPEEDSQNKDKCLRVLKQHAPFKYELAMRSLHGV